MSEPIEGPHVARLVTFLGRGNYHTVSYEFAGKPISTTPYVCRALADLLRPSEIIVLATEDAKRDHAQGLKDALRAGNLPAPRFEKIPTGRLTGELWEQFKIIKEELRGSKGAVALDITHGFRSQPFFAAAVAAFVHAVDETPPELRVFYGAYDPSHPELGAPILELSEFVALLDWSRALAMFLKTGRAEEAGAATERLGRALAKAWAVGGKQGERPNLDRLGSALRAFGADLQTLRTGDLLIGRGTTKSSVASLMKEVQEAQEHVAKYAPPLADVLDRVVEMVAPIGGVGRDLSGPEGRKAIVELAGLYLRLGCYLEALATVREGWVNLYASKPALIPGSDAFDPNERDRAEKRVKNHDPTFRNEVAHPRNDFLHAQYRSSAQKAADIADTVKRLVETLRIASETPRGACFVNLSNHPIDTWEDAQRKAALALAERIEDIAFPAVPPDADEKAIAALAEECAAKVPPETSHALVQGEFTLTVELVRRLQARGITCLAATSKRNVKEDGDGRRTSSFAFVRFRTYPSLAWNNTTGPEFDRCPWSAGD
jgi:CRISPR-associated protein Csx16